MKKYSIIAILLSTLFLAGCLGGSSSSSSSVSGVGSTNYLK